MAGDDRPWFLYHCTRGAHFDNYPHELPGRSPAKHPYKDTIIELDDIVGRLVAALERTGQLEQHAGVHLVRQRAGDGDLARLRVHAVPLREGVDVGRRACACPAVVSWPGMIDAGARRDGMSHLLDLFATVLARSPAAATRCPTDRFVDSVDQTSFLLAPPTALSNRKFQLLLAHGDASRRCGSASTST